jgi:hypothetical protein
MQTDLVGIPVTLASVAVFGLAIGAFFVAGPVAGLLFSILGLCLVYQLAGGGTAEERPRLVAVGGGPRDREHVRRVLVVANRGLGRADLPARLQRIGARHPAEIRIVVPGAARTRLHVLTDDFDAERHEALKRMAELVELVRSFGIRTSGRIDDGANPREALADGVREFRPDEILLVRGDERGWDDAVALADELRSEARLPVTKLNGERLALAHH